MKAIEKLSPIFNVIESLDLAGVSLGGLDRALKDGPAMTSLELAERAGKNHYDVLKDIRDKVSKLQKGYGEKSVSFKDLGFYSSTYKTCQGKELPCFLLSDKGHLYVIRNTETGRCKIGFSKSPARDSIPNPGSSGPQGGGENPARQVCRKTGSR